MKSPGAGKRIWPLLATILLMVGSGYGQAGRSELTGIVVTGDGQAIPGATIRIRQSGTNDATTTISGADGSYAVAGLPPGEYRVEIEAERFQRQVREGVRLSTGERIRLDFALSVGKIFGETVIRSDASMLRTESSSLGQVIPHQTIVSLPLNGRNFFTLIGLAPGVATPPPVNAGPSLPRLNGGRPRVNEFLYDGISALQPEPGQVAFYPLIEAIEEFKVENNVPAAEFGRFNGGVINLTTRAGTNSFHGSAFGFLRHETLNARHLMASAKTSPARPLFRRQQYGLVAGGPLRPNQTFFFADYQGTRQAVARVVTSTVPSAAQRQGDFSATLGPQLFLHPQTLTATKTDTGTPIEVLDTTGRLIAARVGQIFRPGDRRVYPGNLIPANDLDPLARRLAARYPLPTSEGRANNFTRTANERLAQEQADLRIDQRISQFGRVFGRFSIALEVATPVTPLPDGSGAIAQGFLGRQRSGGYQGMGSYQQIIGARMINEIRGGVTSRTIDRRSLASPSPPSLPGLPESLNFQGVLPTISIAGLQQLGPSPNTNTNFSTTVIQVVELLSVQRLRHSIKLGVDLRLERLTILQPPSPRGTYSFTAPFSGSRGTPDTTGSFSTGSLLSGETGNALASFLLGQVGGFSIDLQPERLRPQAKILEIFGQDDLRITPRLTLNAGLRYTLNFPSTEANNRGAIFNPKTEQLEYAGRDGNPRNARNLEKFNFGPRLGLAWQIGQQTVIRTGYGLVWQEQAGITTPFTLPQFPFIQTVTQRSLDGVTPAFTLSKGPVIEPIKPDGNAGRGQGVFAVDRDLGSGYAQQWNLAIQRALGDNMVGEVAYAGSKITHVGIPDSNINQLTVAQLSLGPQLLQQVPNPFFGEIPRSSPLGDPTIPRAQLLRPFPRFTTVSFYRHNVGNTNYHALQAKLEKRLTRGIAFLISYTRSKLIDDAGAVFDASIQSGPIANFPVADTFNRALERDVSTGDLPNVLTASYTIDLNFGKGDWLRALRRGWRMTGMAIIQSGLPFPVTQITNFNAFAGFGVQRPNLLRSPRLPRNARSTNRWFDTDAFRIAPQFSLGTSSRNPVRGPGYRTFDLAIIKMNRLGDTVDLEWRAEVFNLTNTPPLGTPNGVAGSGAFGSITTAGDPRVIQLGLKLYF